MKLSYYFRRPSPVFHSIEEQFFAVQKELPEEVVYKNIFAKYHSKGFFRRLFIVSQLAVNQGEINHITGDIHFIALLLNKKKTILTVHDIGSVLKDNGLKQKILRFFWFTMPFARVKYITVISEFTKQEILENFKINPDKIIVIPDCVSSKITFSEKVFNAEKPNILQIGTKPNKNLENLIPALSEIHCKLTIIGKLSENQIQLLKKYHIDYKSFFNLPFLVLINEYKKADLVTFISVYEGFGVPILEAQASGRPVITSNISPMKEVAGNGALLVNPYSVNEIKSTVNQLINNTELRKNLIKNGLKNVKNYSAKSVTLKYFELYKTITKTNISQ
ncbi:MAG: glycosyltransferase family 4 protein [Bacteroidales bacterium]|nr:glycosyltransferase family 4 protein [Bacteroidales bacterium]